MSLRRTLKRFSLVEKSESWHEQVDRLANGEPPLTEQWKPNPAFPWEGVRRCTDTYLARRATRNIDNRDSCLILLVRNHSSKKTAMAAIGHALSAQAVRELLSWEFGQEHSPFLLQSWEFGQEYRPFLLQATIIFHSVHPNAINQEDAQLAHRLLELTSLGHQNVRQKFELALSIFETRRTSDFTCSRHIDPISSAAFAAFATYLDSLAKDYRYWLHAFTISRSLTRVVSILSSSPGLRGLLDTAFPTWEQWAMWRPDPTRLRIWQTHTATSLTNLRDVISLEGWDQTGCKQVNFLEGVMAQRVRSQQQDNIVLVGSLRIIVDGQSADEVHNVLQLLCEAMDSSCRAGPESLRLFNLLCWSPLTRDRLHILNLLNELADPSITVAMEHIYCTTNVKQHRAAVENLLYGLSGDRMAKLRQLLSLDLANRVTGAMINLQRELRTSLDQERKLNRDKAQELQRLGHVLLRTKWMIPFLHETQQRLLPILPKAEALRALQEINDYASYRGQEAGDEITSLVIDYCQRRFFVQEVAVLDSIKHVKFDAFLEFWPTVEGSIRQGLAILLITSLQNAHSLADRCFSTLAQLPESILDNLEDVLWRHRAAPTEPRVALASLAQDLPESSDLQPWVDILRFWLDRQQAAA